MSTRGTRSTEVRGLGVIASFLVILAVRRIAALVTDSGYPRSVKNDAIVVALFLKSASESQSRRRRSSCEYGIPFLHAGGCEELYCR